MKHEANYFELRSKLLNNMNEQDREARTAMSTKGARRKRAVARLFELSKAYESLYKAISKCKAIKNPDLRTFENFQGFYQVMFDKYL